MPTERRSGGAGGRVYFRGYRKFRTLMEKNMETTTVYLGLYGYDGKENGGR